MLGDGEPKDLLLLRELIQKLKAEDERQGRVAEMHFFDGLSIEEIAIALKVSPRTVKRDWAMAKAWLRSQIALRES